VLQIFPFLAYLAVVTSAVLLVLLSASGEVGRTQRVVLAAWLLAAGYCQFFGISAAVATAGLALQTALAVYLILRWKLSV
jgi:hypothetical protein